MKSLCLSLFLFLSLFSNAQLETPYAYDADAPEWVKYMYSDQPDVYHLRELYEEFYAKNEFVKSNHTQYYKRLLKHFWTDLDENGRIKNSIPISNTQKSPTSAWEELGPWDYDHEQAIEFEVQSPGAAHVYTVEQSPINPDVVYAGTATAGLWKSVDKGLNWTLMTRDYAINGVYSIALDSIDLNIVYFGESSGQIWKSLDGGVSWNLTGDAAFQASSHFVRDLKMIAPNTLLAATEDGLFRSNDGGANWLMVNSGEHMEIELKPDDNNVIYAVRIYSNQTQFYKSTDNGLTWTLKPTGWPNPVSGDEQKRCEIAVSADSPEEIFILASGKVGADEGLYGIYKSADAGESFTFECCGGAPGGTPNPLNPNMLGWSEDGSEGGGQYYYDLAMGVSPNDANRMFGSGINVWRSENGGTTWELNAHWVTWVGPYTKDRYSHADVHDIKFFKHAGGTDMWVASDGGLFYSSTEGDTLEPRMHGIHGTDFWGFGAGFKNGYVMVGGTYHNGTLIRYNDIYKGGLANPEEGGWLAELGGDNYRGFVNYGDTMVGYADNGAFYYSTVRETRKTSRSFDGSKKCNTTYVTGEYGTYGFAPTCFNIIYSPVGTELYRSADGGSSFELVHDFGGSKLIQVKTSWADPQVIYVTHKFNSSVFKIWKTTDGGATWEDVTGNLLATTSQGNKVKYIELDEKDADKLWCILIGSQTGNKVFESTDAGASWVDLTTLTIAYENVISISHQYGTDDGLYIGTTQNVYYKNAGMADWALFNNNLPLKTSASFLEPFYSERKIRAASQRGVYQCDFYEVSTPVAMPSANTINLNLSQTCSADTVKFMDHSTVDRSTATWLWTFEGATPVSSTEENPVVVYSAAGTYDVTLVVTDQYGQDSITIQNFISVSDTIGSLPNIYEDFNGEVFPPEGWKLYDSEGTSWEQDWPEGNDSDRMASYPNYWVDAYNQTHQLIMPSVDLTNGQNIELTFDCTYNDNGSYTDTLAVVYRSASNPEWQTIWAKGGQDLESAGTEVWYWYNADPSYTFNFETVDLSFLSDESCVEIAFENRGYYGNHIWLDNVNLTGDYTDVDEIQDHFAFVYPNPSSGVYQLKSSKNIDRIEIYNIAGEVILTGADIGNHLKVDLSKENSGMYLMKLYCEQGVQTIRLIKH